MGPDESTDEPTGESTHPSTSLVPPVLWAPGPGARSDTRLGAFWDRCEAAAGQGFDDYDELWAWSVGDGLETCWAAIWEHFEVIASRPYEWVLDRRDMPGATWFGGARLNYAEHLLRHARPDQVAIVGRSQSRDRIELTWDELSDQVGRARVGLRRLGVGPGDRVAAYLPNVPETIVAFIAAASLGAIWTSCAPEFGVQAVLDRFTQVEPKVLLAVDGYRYGRHQVSRTEELAAIRAGLPSLAATVLLPYGDAPNDLADERMMPWDDLVADPGPLGWEQVAPDHPLYVLYSSGTTGMPKPIVHGHGGVLVEHLKVLGLHTDLGADDRFFWFTTTGWMMWNFVVSGLLVGARVVLFDGDPNHAGPDTLWRLAAEEQLTCFGGGAPYFSACRKAGLRPIDDLDLSALRVIGSTGAPLPADAFDWIYDAVSPSVLLSPISGGTDICSAFVGGSPLTPVWRGEIPCRYLGAAVASFDEAGAEVVGGQGELVVTEPMPSMPVGFWGDEDGSRYRSSYFDHYPGIWRHGDWITISERGSCVISGRSDATLNRGGVRVGTAEIYRVVESVPGVADSLVVHLEATDADDPGTLVLFVAPAEGTVVDDDLVDTIRRTCRSELSPRHVPDEVRSLTSIPTTLSGKKLELPVKKILGGAAPDDVASRGSLKNPGSLDEVAHSAAHERIADR